MDEGATNNFTTLLVRFRLRLQLARKLFREIYGLAGNACLCAVMLGGPMRSVGKGP